MSHPAGNPRRYSASRERDAYHAILERFHEWCVANDRGFCVELAAFCQRTMGEEVRPLLPAYASEVAAPRVKAPPRPAPRRDPPGRPWSRQGRAIYNDRGEHFRSVNAAARALKVTTQKFSHYVASGRCFDGTLWHVAPPTPPAPAAVPSPEKERAA